MKKLITRKILSSKSKIWKTDSIRKSKKMVYHYTDVALDLVGNVLWPQSREIREIKITELDLP